MRPVSVILLLMCGLPICLEAAVVATDAASRSNMVCENAVPITDGKFKTNNVGAHNGSCVVNCTGNAVWFSYRTPRAGTLRIIGEADSNDIQLGLFKDCFDESPECHNDYLVNVPNMEFAEIWEVDAGMTYYISIAHCDDFEGNITLEVSTRAAANDLCPNATMVPADGNVLGVGNAAATVDASTQNTIMTHQCPVYEADVWFNWAATCTGSATIAVDAARMADAVLVVWWGGNCSNLTFVACTDTDETVTMNVQHGDNYYFSVGSAMLPDNCVGPLDYRDLVIFNLTINCSDVFDPNSLVPSWLTFSSQPTSQMPYDRNIPVLDPRNDRAETYIIIGVICAVGLFCLVVSLVALKCPRVFGLEKCMNRFQNPKPAAAVPPKQIDPTQKPKPEPLLLEVKTETPDAEPKSPEGDALGDLLWRWKCKLSEQRADEEAKAAEAQKQAEKVEVKSEDPKSKELALTDKPSSESRGLVFKSAEPEPKVAVEEKTAEAVADTKFQEPVIAEPQEENTQEYDLEVARAHEGATDLERASCQSQKDPPRDSSAVRAESDG